MRSTFTVGATIEALFIQAPWLNISSPFVGVVPGKGINPDVNGRRLSFMVGFWKKICAKVSIDVH
jgi:hypothetical protein